MPGLVGGSKKDTGTRLNGGDAPAEDCGGDDDDDSRESRPLELELHAPGSMGCLDVDLEAGGRFSRDRDVHDGPDGERLAGDGRYGTDGNALCVGGSLVFNNTGPGLPHHGETLGTRGARNVYFL
eukprot:SAG11_NODE_1375_length_5086_cov_98.730499_6_plen_125_part_00